MHRNDRDRVAAQRGVLVHARARQDARLGARAVRHADERRAVMAIHRYALLGMGMVVGLMGAGPSLIWSAGLMTIAMAPLLLPVSMWLYVLVFSFASMWFIHFCLAALHALRQRAAPAPLSPDLELSLTANS